MCDDLMVQRFEFFIENLNKIIIFANFPKGVK